MIADGGDEAGFGSEVIEVDPLGTIVWRYDDNEKLRFAHSARRMKNGNTLITDTTNNRLIEVTPEKTIVMSSDDWGESSGRLSDGSHLHYPNEAFALDDGMFLVTDRNNDRCLYVDRDGNVLWSFGEQALHHPHNATPLSTGNVLVSDSDGNRIIEVNRNKEIVWSYGNGSIETLWWPRGAVRLESGNTLVTDGKNHRLLEVTPDGKIAWRFQTPHVDRFYLTSVTEQGTLLTSSTDGHHQVIEIDRARNYAWMFRNYRRPFPIHSTLSNGFFKKVGEDGVPEDWVLATRLSEGGGKMIWDSQSRSRPSPGIELDRDGALFLQQTIALEPQALYRIGAEVKTEEVLGSAGIQLDFFDAYGGSIYEEMIRMPSGELHTGNSPWESDSFEVRVPSNATYAELRLFLNNQGRVYVRNVMVGKI